jgi:hypothetical protein
MAVTVRRTGMSGGVTDWVRRVYLYAIWYVRAPHMLRSRHSWCVARRGSGGGWPWWSTVLGGLSAESGRVRSGVLIMVRILRLRVICAVRVAHCSEMGEQSQEGTRGIPS